MSTLIHIDGSVGEGGGQMLRTSLTLSLLTGKPFRISHIRAGRKKPGILRQHLACVVAAQEISSGEATGANLGSTELTFVPGQVGRHGAHRAGLRFSTGGAGSTTLVLQTLLLPLLLRITAPVELTFEGGTHNPMAPPVDFLQRTFLPLMEKLGAKIDMVLERPGFYPAGGGLLRVTVHPAPKLTAFSLLERGDLNGITGLALLSLVPPRVGLRECAELSRLLSLPSQACRPHAVDEPRGPGNVLLAFVESEHITEVMTSFGERGVTSEAVAARVAKEVVRYLDAKVPVGEHLADQLLLPLAVGGGGSFRTVEPSQHFHTQVEVIRKFMPTSIRVTKQGPDQTLVEVEA